MSVKLKNKDYIWSYIGVFVSLGANVVMLPFMLYYLSGDMYGLWSVFQSAMAITTLFDFGFSASFARNINYCWCGASELKKTGVVYSDSGEPNFLLMKRTMTACRYVFLIISGVALICMAGPGSIYIRHISREIPGREPMIAWGIYAVAVFLNLYYGYFNSFLRGVGAISDANRVTVVAKAIQVVLTVGLLACGAGIVGTGVAYLVYGILLRWLSKRAFFHYHGIGKKLNAVPENPSQADIIEIFRVIWPNASKAGIVMLFEYLANQTCILILPLFLSLRLTGMFSLAVQLATVLSNVAATMYTANQPVLQSAYILNDRQTMKRTMSLIAVSYMGLYVLGMAAVATVGLPILRLLKPDTTPTVMVMLGVGFYQFMLKFRNCYTSYFSCTNRIPYVWAFLISAVAGVTMAAFTLWRGFGIWGLIGAQIISQIVYNFWYWAVKAHREMELSARDTVKYGCDEIKKIVRGFFRRGPI